MSFDESKLAERVAAISAAQLVHVDGGHHVHLDDAAAVAAVVQPFLVGSQTSA
jgi:hypothetical protein